MAVPPVLLLVFNRPDTTAQVFEAIRRARPSRLLVAADGPRPQRPGEAERCAEVRRIATAVDWSCEVQTHFQDQNLGCGRALAIAITWFFENVPEGIILEDDTVPVPAFFEYCSHMLDMYRHQHDVFMVGGYSRTPFEDDRRGHWLSRYAVVWGWATWADRWRFYDRTLPNFDAEFSRARRAGSIRAWEEVFWRSSIEQARQGIQDTWDWPWYFTLFKHDGRCVVPTVNLVSNIGHGHPHAAHHRKVDELMQTNHAREVDCSDLVERINPPPFADERLVTRTILKQRITPLHYVQWCLPDWFNYYVRDVIRRLGVKRPGDFLRVKT